MATESEIRGGQILRGYPLERWVPGEARFGLENDMVLKVEEIRRGSGASVTPDGAVANIQAILAWARSVGLTSRMLGVVQEDGGAPYVVVPVRFFETHVLPELKALHAAPAVVPDAAVDTVAVTAAAAEQKRFMRLARRCVYWLSALVVAYGVSIDITLNRGVGSNVVVDITLVTYFLATLLLVGTMYYAQRSWGRPKGQAQKRAGLLGLALVLPGAIVLLALTVLA